MAVSKIGSKTTYHRHLKDLEKEGFLTYHPSRNPYKGSLITMADFSQNQEVQDMANNWPTGVQVQDQHSTKNWPSPVQVLVPYINSNNNNKQDKEFEEEQSQRAATATHSPLGGNEFLKEKKERESRVPAPVGTLSNPARTSESRAEPESPPPARKFHPPQQEEVTAFFPSQGIPEIEAEKFFNYYQANGWKVGGKTPMKDWKAAARNWIINAKNFNHYEKNKRSDSQRNQTDRIFVDNSPEKDYSKPL